MVGIIFEQGNTYKFAGDLNEVKDAFKNYIPEAFERNINPVYYEIYEFENGYTLDEIEMFYGINIMNLIKNLNFEKKYVLIQKFLNIDYDDSLEKLDKYIEQNGCKAEYIQYDYDTGFYLIDKYVFSDRTGKFVKINDVKEILNNLKY